MCVNIGVDPLASNKGKKLYVVSLVLIQIWIENLNFKSIFVGFWSELLGVGDFYYEL
jgi:hypothetical protein